VTLMAHAAVGVDGAADVDAVVAAAAAASSSSAAVVAAVAVNKQRTPSVEKAAYPRSHYSFPAT
jgi:hypothetical protein